MSGFGTTVKTRSDFRGPPSRQVGHYRNPGDAFADVVGHLTEVINRTVIATDIRLDLDRAMKEEAERIPLGQRRVFNAWAFTASSGLARPPDLVLLTDWNRRAFMDVSRHYYGEYAVTGKMLDPLHIQQRLSVDRLQSSLDDLSQRELAVHGYWRDIVKAQAVTAREQADRQAYENDLRQTTAVNNFNANIEVLRRQLADEAIRQAAQQEIQDGARKWRQMSD